MECEQLEWTMSHSFAEAYIQRFDSVSDRFEIDPDQVNRYQIRSDWLDQSSFPQADRIAVIDHLLQYNERMGNSEALRHVQKLKDPRALVIVGGQQAGLFTGPLLVIYKAVTILCAARDAEQTLGRPVIPIFWIAGEDHDFDEVNHTYLLSHDDQIEKVQLSRRDDKRSPVSQLLVDAKQWEQVITALERDLPDSVHKPEYISLLRTMANQSRTLSEMFARMMASLFGKHGLVLMDSAHTDLRSLEQQFFAYMLNKNEQLSASIMQGRNQVDRLNYPIPVDVVDEAAHLFIIEQGERHLLFRKDAVFTDKKEKLQYSKQQLLARLQQEPSVFSNSVCTRPLMQEYLFPVLGTVLGPGEIAYWGMLKEAFHTFDMRMPLIIPRTEFTLIDERTNKWMNEFSISMKDVAFHFDERRTTWLKEQQPWDIDQQFMDVKHHVTHVYDTLLQKLSLIQPELNRLGQTNLRKVFEQIEYLHKQTERTIEDRHASLLSKWELIEKVLLPFGKKQERVYNVWMYINRYGTTWIDQLIKEPAKNEWHQVVYL